jgi:hypothetical protein
VLAREKKKKKKVAAAWCICVFVYVYLYLSACAHVCCCCACIPCSGSRSRKGRRRERERERERERRSEAMGMHNELLSPLAPAVLLHSASQHNTSVCVLQCYTHAADTLLPGKVQQHTQGGIHSKEYYTTQHYKLHSRSKGTN